MKLLITYYITVQCVNGTLQNIFKYKTIYYSEMSVVTIKDYTMTELRKINYIVNHDNLHCLQVKCSVTTTKQTPLWLKFLCPVRR